MFGHIEVTLTEQECEIVRYLGQTRRWMDRKVGVKDKLVAKENPIEMDVQGIGAEFAFAKLYNLFPPTNVKPRGGSADFVMNGKTIDIKQSKYPNARLIVPPYKLDDDKICDTYVLATGELPTFTFRGFAKKEVICNPKNLLTLRSLVYALSIKDLNPMPKNECSNICC